MPHGSLPRSATWDEPYLREQLPVTHHRVALAALALLAIVGVLGVTGIYRHLISGGAARARARPSGAGAELAAAPVTAAPPVDNPGAGPGPAVATPPTATTPPPGRRAESAAAASRRRPRAARAPQADQASQVGQRRGSAQRPRRIPITATVGRTPAHRQPTGERLSPRRAPAPTVDDRFNPFAPPARRTALQRRAAPAPRRHRPRGRTRSCSRRAPRRRAPRRRPTRCKTSSPSRRPRRPRTRRRAISSRRPSPSESPARPGQSRLRRPRTSAPAGQPSRAADQDPGRPADGAVLLSAGAPSRERDPAGLPSRPSATTLGRRSRWRPEFLSAPTGCSSTRTLTFATPPRWSTTSTRWG